MQGTGRRTEEKIIKQCLREKQPLPRGIAKAPRLAMGLEIFWEAFFALTTCRGGMGGPIPWTAIQSYCNEMGFEGELRERVFHHVRAMDDFVLEQEETRGKNAERPGEPNGGVGG